MGQVAVPTLRGLWEPGRVAGSFGRVTSAKFDEGKTYLVQQLHILDSDGNRKVVDGAAVVFTPGWMFVQEAASDGYVVPRERVLLVQGVKLPRSAD